jgi:hypothetical protein
MSERSERTSKHGPRDGGACGAVNAHWCPVVTVAVNATDDVMEHQ